MFIGICVPFFGGLLGFFGGFAFAPTTYFVSNILFPCDKFDGFIYEWVDLVYRV
jgi:hypothetical protein